MKYNRLILSPDGLKEAIKLQVLAHHRPKRINYPPEPWVPRRPLDKILKRIRDKKVLEGG